MRQNIEVLFDRWTNEWQQRLTECNRQNRLFSTWRGLVALTALGFMVVAALTQNHWYWLPTAAAVAGFIYLVRRHQGIRRKVLKYRNRLRVVAAYKERWDGSWQDPVDSQTFSNAFVHNKESDADEESEVGQDLAVEYIAHDLDLVGPGSLFDYLCTARSFSGRRQLFDWLTEFNVTQQVSRIRKRQHAARELAEKPRFCVELQTLMASVHPGVPRSQASKPDCDVGWALHRAVAALPPFLPRLEWIA
ncbi:MAG TPA: hypothetical protein GX717_00745, partial [Clostridiaceae bacterium]|nr:hypothetical protein [Clostridiaceae bacterium]